LKQHIAFTLDGRILCVGSVALGFYGAQLRVDEIEPGVFAFEFGPKSIGQRAAFAGAQERKIDTFASNRLDAANALPEEKALDPVDMGGAFADQSLPFPMGASRILFLDARHVHDGADMPVATIDRDQGPQQHQHVDPVSLDASCASVDLKTGRIKHTAIDAFGRQ
jgi:hypothetical protein